MASASLDRGRDSLGHASPSGVSDGYAARPPSDKEEMLRALFHGPVAMAVSAADGRWRRVNDAFLLMIGFEPEEVLGKTGAEMGLFDEPTAAARLVRSIRRGAQVRNPLVHRGTPQRPPCRPAQAVEEIRLPDREAGESAAFVEDHGVAEQAVGRGQAAGGDRRRAGPGGGREDAAELAEERAFVTQARQRRRVAGSDQVAAQAVADDQDHPLHGW